MKRKIEIMKRPTLTDAEIEGFMDFDALVVKAQTKPGLGKWPLYTSLLLIVGIVGLGVWLQNKPDSVPNLEHSQQVVPSPQPEAILSNIKVDSVEAVIEPTTERIVINKPETKKDITESKTKTRSGYRQAAPVGGYEKLYEYFNSAIHYPETAISDSIQGVVVVDFVINISGNPEQIQIQQSLCAACDKEAIRVIENMESWLPARLNDKPVPARVSVPLTFQLIQSN
jgi:TonB family protein